MLFQSFLVFLECSGFSWGVPGFLGSVPGFFGVFRVFGCSGMFRDVPVFRCSGVPVFRCSWKYYMPTLSVLFVGQFYSRRTLLSGINFQTFWHFHFCLAKQCFSALKSLNKTVLFGAENRSVGVSKTVLLSAKIAQ